MIEDDVFGSRLPRPPGAEAGHQLGQDLSTLSEVELEERIAALQAEIERLRSALAVKRSSRAAADAFFRR